MEQLEFKKELDLDKITAHILTCRSVNNRGEQIMPNRDECRFNQTCKEPQKVCNICGDFELTEAKAKVNVEPLVMQKITDIIKDYESGKIRTTKEFAGKVYALGYNDHLKLMNEAFGSMNIFMLKEI